MTILDVANAVNQIVNKYTGQTIAMPNGTYKGQCSVPAVEYVMALTGLPFTSIPPMAGDSAEGWGLSFPQALASYFTHEPYQAGKAYPKGTLLIWNSPHIAIVLSPPTSNTVDVFEQDADPNGSPCHSATRTINMSTHNCVYALVPITTATVSTPSTPSTVSASGNYVLNKGVPGYREASQAAAHADQADTVQPNVYSIFNEAGGMINVTSKAGEAGSWINPADNDGTEPAKVVTTKDGWGLEAIAQADNLPNAGQVATWQLIAKLNGSNDWRAFNASLKPDQKVIVP